MRDFIYWIVGFNAGRFVSLVESASVHEFAVIISID
jgi:hypothetical protein